jgi:hypothetical protein
MSGLNWLTRDSTVRILYLQRRRFDLYKTGTVLCPGNAALWTPNNHQQNQELLKIDIFNRDTKNVFYEVQAAFLNIIVINIKHQTNKLLAHIMFTITKLSDNQISGIFKIN